MTDESRTMIAGLPIEVAPLDKAQAMAAGLLRPATRHLGCPSATAPVCRSHSQPLELGSISILACASNASGDSIRLSDDSVFMTAEASRTHLEFSVFFLCPGPE